MATPSLQRADTHFVGGNLPDPFQPRGRFLGSFFNALLATAFFRCWHLMVFFAGWSTMICLIIDRVRDISINNTLLTVFGTVLGFVISYRTSSSFERYNEGRKFWSAIIHGSRTFARTVWFHIPEKAAVEGKTPQEIIARTLIEKKTVLNLIEAFAVSVKHYLRGEEGTNYVDLYHLVRFLPAYALPAGLPTSPYHRPIATDGDDDVPSTMPQLDPNTQLPLPATAGLKQRPSISVTPAEKPSFAKGSLATQGAPVKLLPARNPPKTSIYDIWPFSLLVHVLTKKGKSVGGKKAARERAKMGRGTGVESKNIPLEISLYLSSYISALQQRKTIDVPTTNLLIAALNQLVDSLTGLERILTTPIPFSYAIHLWTVTMIYCLTFPFQLWKTMGWLTIPSTIVAAFIFFGFIVAGEEIENPFGFDRNDLNMDHFTQNIIRVELQALTALPVPDPAQWAFQPDNDVFANDDSGHIHKPQTATPEDWVKRGPNDIGRKLAEQNPGKNGSAPAENPAPNPAHNAGAVGAGGAAGGAAGTTGDQGAE